MQKKLNGRSAPPTVPPKDYYVRDLSPLPEDPVPPPRRKRSIAEFQNIDASQKAHQILNQMLKRVC